MRIGEKCSYRDPEALNWLTCMCMNVSYPFTAPQPVVVSSAPSESSVPATSCVLLPHSYTLLTWFWLQSTSVEDPKWSMRAGGVIHDLDATTSARADGADDSNFYRMPKRSVWRRKLIRERERHLLLASAQVEEPKLSLTEGHLIKPCGPLKRCSQRLLRSNQ